MKTQDSHHLKLPVWDLRIALALSDRWNDINNKVEHRTEGTSFFMQDAKFSFEHIKI